MSSSNRSGGIAGIWEGGRRGEGSGERWAWLRGFGDDEPRGRSRHQGGGVTGCGSAPEPSSVGRDRVSAASMLTPGSLLLATVSPQPRVTPVDFYPRVSS
jgi:hypothetical protein